MLRSSATTVSSALAAYRTTRRHISDGAHHQHYQCGCSPPSAATSRFQTSWRRTTAERCCTGSRTALVSLCGALRAASTTPPPHSACADGDGMTTAAEQARDVAAAEEELCHLQQDVRAFASDLDSSTALAPAASASSSSVAPAVTASAHGDAETTEEGHGSSGGASGSGDSIWEEPTLADLDRSIPQVDCEFIASLIRSRNLRRDEFLNKKEVVKQRVDQLTKKTTSSVSDAARLPLVGGLGFGWFANQKNSSEFNTGSDSGVVATSSDAPVVVSADVLEQLNDEERDLLHTTRPDYDDGFVLIDCRTVNEVTSWGIVEGAKVLPAHELFEAFHATPEDFLHDYGFAKPRPDDIIICYCQYGPRSLMAAQLLSWMGYLKVLHFRDGYYEWGKQYNLLLRRWMEHDKESGNELRRLATFRAGLELQREIAPEFNALPMKEAQKYLRDTTRSPGALLVGEGLRLEAYTMVAKLTEGLAPPALPGVLDSASDAAASTAADGTVSGLPSRSTQARRSGEQHLTQFLEQATGLDPQREMRRPATGVSFGEAQATVLDSLASGAELGAPPDTQASPLHRPSRPN